MSDAHRARPARAAASPPSAASDAAAPPPTASAAASPPLTASDAAAPPPAASDAAPPPTASDAASPPPAASAAATPAASDPAAPPFPASDADLERLYDAALAAADPGAAVERALAGGALADLAGRPRLVLFALGKAAPAMARAALARLGARVAGGVVVAPVGLAAPCPPLDVYAAPHPLPDARSLAAGRALLARARRLAPDEGALVLVSGGASALAEAPAPGLELDDLRRANDLFLKSGLPIDAVNALRRALSDLKGGRLGEAFGGAPFVTLVLSDVVRGGPALVGSGPTAPAAPTESAAGLADLARRAGLWDALPPAARRLLAAPRPPPALPPRPLFVVADVGAAAGAAARAAEALGYPAEIISLSLEGEARAAGAALAGAALARQASPGGRRCLVWGGETTVRVRGGGRGGRNQELALAAALALEGRAGVRLLAVATDGVDGPTDAAGARVDGQTAAKVRAAGLDPAALLDDNDAHRALAAAGALVRRGPTGTNVNDLVIALIDDAPALSPDATPASTLDATPDAAPASAPDATPVPPVEPAYPLCPPAAAISP